MPAGPRIDTKRLTVTVEGAELPFTLDARAGAVRLATAAGPVSLRPLTWAERAWLARLAELGRDRQAEALLQLASNGDLPDALAPAAREAAVALAAWIDRLGAGPAALPLDIGQMAAAALRICQATGWSLAALDARPALEVEALAAVAIAPGEPQVGRAAQPVTSPAPADLPTAGVTRILVVPDPSTGSRDDMARPAAPGSASAAAPPSPASRTAPPGDPTDGASRPAAGVAGIRPVEDFATSPPPAATAKAPAPAVEGIGPSTNPPGRRSPSRAAATDQRALRRERLIPLRIAGGPFDEGMSVPSPAGPDFGPPPASNACATGQGSRGVGSAPARPGAPAAPFGGPGWQAPASAHRSGGASAGLAARGPDAAGTAGGVSAGRPASASSANPAADWVSRDARLPARGAPDAAQGSPAPGPSVAALPSVHQFPRADAVRSGRLPFGPSPTRLPDEPCAPTSAGAGLAVADTGDIADALAEALADAARDLGIDLDG